MLYVRASEQKGFLDIRRFTNKNYYYYYTQDYTERNRLLMWQIAAAVPQCSSSTILVSMQLSLIKGSWQDPDERWNPTAELCLLLMVADGDTAR